MIALFILVANQVAIQCLGTDCQHVDYFLASQLIKAGTLELIFEVVGFIRIYVRRDKNNKKGKDK
jgi:hypothetical protein